MSLLAPDVPYGSPAFALSDDQVATVLDLVCRGAYGARLDVSPGMLEVPVTIVVRKAIRRLKRTLGLTNLQLRGEHELENMATTDPSILGRIDITLQFLHQFGDEDAYVGIECKKLGRLRASRVSGGRKLDLSPVHSQPEDRGVRAGTAHLPGRDDDLRHRRVLEHHAV